MAGGRIKSKNPKSIYVMDDLHAGTISIHPGEYIMGGIKIWPGIDDAIEVLFDKGLLHQEDLEKIKLRRLALEL